MFRTTGTVFSIRKLTLGQIGAGQTSKLEINQQRMLCYKLHLPLYSSAIGLLTKIFELRLSYAERESSVHSAGFGRDYLLEKASSVTFLE